MSRRSVRLAAVALALVAATLPMISGAPTAMAQGANAVVINEFMPNNGNNLADNTGEFEDWIELANTTGSVVNLSGWTISDSNDTFTFPNSFSVPANGFRVIFASGDTSRTSGSELHLPFKLNADTEPLILRNAAGTVSSPSWPAPGYPTIPVNVSYGRTSGGGLGFFTSPSPGASNNNASNGIVEPVTFSLDHGFYAANQTVTLDTTTPSATIRYTTNGSTPTATSGNVLSPGQTISVSATTVVRAVAYRTGWIPSGVETRTYLFTDDILTQAESAPAGWPASLQTNNHKMDYGMDPTIVNANPNAITTSLTTIPTISIVTDLENLVDANTGIYVNGQSTGPAWERPASIELIDPSGNEAGFDINAGLRIRGGGSRRPDNPKHSFRLYFRNEYDGNLEYPMFGPNGDQQFESIGLATGQNGSWSYRGEEEATWIREMWSRETQGAMGQPNTDSRFYHLYLNGRYWGLYYTQERVSNGFGVEKFGGNEGDYDVITASWRSAGTATDGTIDAWNSLYQYVDDLQVSASEFPILDSLVDMENLADYYLLHYFSGDWDGSPMGWTSNNGPSFRDSNNWRALRNRAGIGEAGKWIFFDHDSEFTLCGPASPLTVDNTDWNLAAGSVPNHKTPTPAWLHQSLLTHPAYRQIFQDRVALHMQTPGGALTPAVNQARVDLLAAEVSPAIDAESARWGDSLGDPANTRADWQSNVNTLRACAADRFNETRSQLTADGLWPTQAPPIIAPGSGAVPFGTDVSVVANGNAGTIWVTTDGSDPRSAGGGPSATAFAYAGPVPITSATTVSARVLDGATWTPMAQVDYTLSTPAGPIRLALNEYNAVGSAKFLGGGTAAEVANGTDVTLGRIAGNGGDWFELIVIDDQLDVRGWTVEIWHLNNGLLERSAALTFDNDALLSSLQSGTLLTVSEDIPDDTSFRPAAGDWHINLQANSDNQGDYFTTQENFAIDNDDTQIAIFDATGDPVALRTGEGTVDGISVSSEEVFKLEGPATSSLNANDPSYADGTSSTWGQPNVWSNNAETQDLSNLRIMYGDTDCNGQMNVLDAVFVAQYVANLRTARNSCPINLNTEIMLPAADVNSTNHVNVLDAVWIAQCVASLPNDFCPQ